MRRPGALAGILVLAAVFRLVSIDQDLPLFFEEATPMRVAAEMWRADGGVDFDPAFFNYPSLVIYANLAAQGIVLVGGLVSGAYASTADALVSWRSDPTPIALAGRLLSVLAGVLAVWAVHRLGAALAGGRVGLVAAFALAVSPWHLGVSRMILVDGPLVLFVALALEACVRLARGLRINTALGAGVFVGLAASCKYPGALSAVAVVVAALVGARAAGRPAITAFSTRPLWLAGSVAIAAFVVTSPYVLLEWRAFLDHFGIERMHMREGHFGLDPTGAIAAYARAIWNLGGGWGVPFLLVGAAHALRRLTREPAALPLLTHAVLVIVVIGSWSMYGAHYLAPAVPPLCVFMGLGVVCTAEWVGGRVSATVVRVGLTALAALAFAVGGSALDRYTRPHTRAIAREWLVEHLGEGTTIVHEHRTVDVSADPVLAERTSGVRLPMTTLEPERSAPFYSPRWFRGLDYVMVSDAVRGRYERDPTRFAEQTAFYDSLDASWTLAVDIPAIDHRGSRIRIYSRADTLHPDADAPLDPALLASVGRDTEDVAATFLAELGDACLSRGMSRRAIDAYGRAMELDPEREGVLYNLGTLLLASGRPDEAAPLFERAHALAPDRVQTLNNLGVARLQSGDAGGALEAFRSAVEIDPEHPNARRNLDRLLAERAGTGAAGDGIDFWLTLLHNNDGESRLLDAGPGEEDVGGIARFVSVVDRLRAEHHGRAAKRAAPCGLVIVSAGDSYLAGPELAASRRAGLPWFDALGMAAIGYDALAIGNHELDFGPDALADFIESMSMVEGDRAPPCVSANLDVSGHARLDSLRASGRLVRSTVRVREGRKIGIVGATTPRLDTISAPGVVEADADVSECIQAEVDALTARGVSIVVLISHLQDIREDLSLIGTLRNVDVAVAGGGDEILASEDAELVPGDEVERAGDYPLLVADATGERVRVVTTSGQYRYVGCLVLGFDAQGRVIATDREASDPVRVVDAARFADGVSPAPRVVESVDDPLRERLRRMGDETVARSEVPLDGRRARVRTRPTNLGRLVADAVLWSARRSAAGGALPRADLAIHNGGGIRNDTIVPPGEVTALDIHRIVPFPNFVTVATVDAARLVAILETALSALPDASGGYPQTAGVTLEVDPARSTGRVRRVTLADGRTLVRDGMVVEGAGSVTLAATDFLCDGGDAYPLTDALCRSTGETVLDAVIAYLEEALGGTIGPARYAPEREE